MEVRDQLGRAVDFHLRRPTEKLEDVVKVLLLQDLGEASDIRAMLFDGLILCDNRNVVADNDASGVVTEEVVWMGVHDALAEDRCGTRC